MASGFVIQVQYTPQITSTSADSPFICHYICYRNTDDGGSYCCFEDDTDSYAGTPKQFDITLGDDPCSPHINDFDPDFEANYDGYVQPCCDDDDSRKVTWSVTWIPPSP